MMLNLLTLFSFFGVSYLSCTVWYPTFLHLASQYTRLMSKPNRSFFTKVWISCFSWTFLFPCALLTNDRIHPTVWLLGFMYLKNVAYHTESLTFGVISLLYVLLLFEHLAFAFICHSFSSVNDFFNDIFGSDLIFYCLGNMWKAPAKKLGVAAGAVGYEVAITAISEQAGTAVANDIKVQFPNLTVQEYSQVRTDAANKFYTRWSVGGNFGRAVGSFFEGWNK